MVLTDTIQRDAVISFPGLGGLTMNPPASFTVFGHEIYLYGVMIALGFLLGTLLCGRLAPGFGIAADDFYDLMLRVIPVSIIGARLYYVAFQAEYYLEHPAMILAVREGGLAVYGGLMAGAAATLLFCRRRRIPVLRMLDLMVFGVLLGQALGRWGNFFNREAFGTETGIFCRMGLTAPDGTTVYVHPTFLYESLWNLAGLAYLLARRKRRRYEGEFFLFYLFWYGLGRAWIEGLRTDSLCIGDTGIRVSQVLSVVLCVGAVAAHCRIKRGK